MKLLKERGVILINKAYTRQRFIGKIVDNEIAQPWAKGERDGPPLLYKPFLFHDHIHHLHKVNRHI